MISTTNIFEILEKFQYFIDIYNWTINVFSYFNISIKHFVIYSISIVIFLSVCVPQMMLMIWCFLWYIIQLLRQLMWSFTKIVGEWLWFLTSESSKFIWFSTIQFFKWLWLNANHTYSSRKHQIVAVQVSSNPRLIKANKRK